MEIRLILLTVRNYSELSVRGLKNGRRYVHNTKVFDFHKNFVQPSTSFLYRKGKPTHYPPLRCQHIASV